MLSKKARGFSSSRNRGRSAVSRRRTTEIPLFILSFYIPIPQRHSYSGLVNITHHNRSLFLSSPNVLSHPPMPYVIRAWWTSSIGQRWISSSPGSWRPPPVGGMRPSCLTHWWLTCWRGWFYSGDVYFSQDHPPPHPTSHSPAMA